MFGRGTSWEEGVFNDTVVYLHARFEQLLQWDCVRLTPGRLQEYCEHLNVPGQRCFGFIDGTQRIICRPGTLPQRTWYSGYKKCHGIKFQGVTTPDGLLSHLDGAYYRFKTMEPSQLTIRRVICWNGGRLADVWLLSICGHRTCAWPSSTTGPSTVGPRHATLRIRRPGLSTRF
jgi:hypothetical protein